ncbi:MAG: FUN14 domain-containing protein [Nitrososphaerales archaeon]
MSLDIIAGPLASQLAIGGIIGFLIGFALKKMTKIALVLAGIFFVTLVYLEYNQFITINYEQFELAINGFLQNAGINFALPSFLATNLPLIASFGGALAFGLKKG